MDYSEERSDEESVRAPSVIPRSIATRNLSPDEGEIRRGACPEPDATAIEKEILRCAQDDIAKGSG
jgi:hypothetical protein